MDVISSNADKHDYRNRSKIHTLTGLSTVLLALRVGNNFIPLCLRAYNVYTSSLLKHYDIYTGWNIQTQDFRAKDNFYYILKFSFGCKALAAHHVFEMTDKYYVK